MCERQRERPAEPRPETLVEASPAKVKLPKRSEKGKYGDELSLKGMRFVAEKF